MIRKRWRDGEPVLSVETEDEFGKALATGEAVELTRELADQLGMMEDDTITWAEAKAARDDPGVRVAMERKPGVFGDHAVSVRDSSSGVDACHALPGRARR